MKEERTGLGPQETEGRKKGLKTLYFIPRQYKYLVKGMPENLVVWIDPVEPSNMVIRNDPEERRTP